MSEVKLSPHVRSLIERMRDRLYCLAMEDADTADQADAAALANEADELLVMAVTPWACHCDIENTVDGLPDACVFDNGDIEDCIYAVKLQREGKGKAQCKYWLPAVSKGEE
jgi:hypothetical protein